MASLPNSRAKRQTNEKAQALRQQIDESIDVLAKAVDDVRASDVFRQYLATQPARQGVSRRPCRETSEHVRGLDLRSPVPGFERRSVCFDHEQSEAICLYSGKLSFEAVALSADAPE